MNLRPREECRYDLVALGEVMLRLDPGEARISTARSFRVWEGGGAALNGGASDAYDSVELLAHAGELGRRDPAPRLRFAHPRGLLARARCLELAAWSTLAARRLSRAC